MRLLLTLPINSDFLAGDFYIHHIAWDPAARGESSGGNSLFECTGSRVLTLLNSDKIPTRDAGAVLDIIFSQSTLSSRCRIRPNIGTGSHHRTMLSYMPDLGPEIELPGRLMYKACDWNMFSTTLSGL